jgi:putative intracellular protease/amidase
MAKVLTPLPARDFDPTEVAVSWAMLSALGHDVVFATPDGRPGAADDIMLTGRGLPLVGRLLRANADGRAAYVALLADPAFQAPLRWGDIATTEFDGLLLPGGHRARGMREYLESPVLQAAVVQAFAADKPVAAICHGVLLAARSLDPATGRSVLHGRRTTALTWSLERSASVLAHVFRFWDRHYYRTYVEAPGQPAGFMSVQAEVTRALASPADFLDVPADAPDRKRKTSGLERDAAGDSGPAFVVRDGLYVSARWPGDAHAFAVTFATVLEQAALPDAG